MFDECNSKKRASLQNAFSVVLTTDMWTSVSIEAYLTVTCHLNENWQMREFVLETFTFHGQRTADNISLALKHITGERDTADKVVAVVTDNGINKVAAVHKAGLRRHPRFCTYTEFNCTGQFKNCPLVVP